jgi:hypothetical protein
MWLAVCPLHKDSKNATKSNKQWCVACRVAKNSARLQPCRGAPWWELTRAAWPTSFSFRIDSKTPNYFLWKYPEMWSLMRSIQICNKKMQSVVASGLVSGANSRTPCYSVLYAIALVVGPRDTPCNSLF